MQGNPEIIEALNRQLTFELTAVNQYFIHYKMMQDWGYKRLAKQKYDESLEEMRHADALIDRILFLDGLPNMQRLNPVTVGEDAVEQHRVDLDLELQAQKLVNEAIDLCAAKGDHGSRELFEMILKDEEEAIDWLEAQLHLIGEIGKENYLADQMSE